VSISAGLALVILNGGAKSRRSSTSHYRSFGYPWYHLGNGRFPDPFQTMVARGAVGLAVYHRE
jgi:hypothetical protein